MRLAIMGVLRSYLLRGLEKQGLPAISLNSSEGFLYGFDKSLSGKEGMGAIACLIKNNRSLWLSEPFGGLPAKNLWRGGRFSEQPEAAG
jgi:hypothetical protein